MATVCIDVCIANLKNYENSILDSILVVNLYLKMNVLWVEVHVKKDKITVKINLNSATVRVGTQIENLENFGTGNLVSKIFEILVSGNQIYLVKIEIEKNI